MGFRGIQFHVQFVDCVAVSCVGKVPDRFGLTVEMLESDARRQEWKLDVRLPIAYATTTNYYSQQAMIININYYEQVMTVSNFQVPLRISDP